MATELKLNEDDDNQNPSLSGPMASAGGASGAAGAAASRPTTPSGRPNVQQYLQANQGAGQKLAAGIQSEAQKRADQAASATERGRKELDTQSNPLNQSLGDEGDQKIKTAFKDPQALLNQQGQLDQNNQLAQDWKRYQTEGFKQDIGNLSSTMAEQQAALQNQAGQYNQWQQGASTEAGRFNLLRDTFGQPNYSRGQQKLDQLFLQAQPGVARTLQQDLSAKGKAVQSGVEALDADTEARIAALTGLSSARADQIKNLLASGVDASALEADMTGRGFQDISASSQQRLLDAQGRATQATGIQDRLASRNLSAADVAGLGFGSDGMPLYGVNLGNYISGSGSNPTLAGAADANEFARYRALQQLSGDTTGDIYGGAEAGGGWNPYQFDKSAAQSAVDAARNNLETVRFNELKQQVANNPFNTVGGHGAHLRSAAAAATTPEQLQAAMQTFMQNVAGKGGTVDQGSWDYWFNGRGMPASQYFSDLTAGRGNTLRVTPEDLEKQSKIT
jgi:hypothetical protein